MVIAPIYCDRCGHSPYSWRRDANTIGDFAGQGKNKGKDVMKPKNSSTQLRALVVDDDRVIQKTHEGLLKKVGVKNHTAVENGKKAVDLHCNGERFDLILIDKDMPVMNGIEATKKLRSMGICNRIVGVSSLCDTENIQQFLLAGIDEYYKKPLTVKTLKAILDNIES
ncbi:hypothetical protein VNO78_17535 [Psophocarpus tetragonolobus]|uniref:Response regulatory domain-containing protein n=1 Tax=Psophocarpus tetragonolobus TaxID=3891 RepID=A0AAN9XKS2_PSOTE